MTKQASANTQTENISQTSKESEVQATVKQGEAKGFLTSKLKIPYFFQKNNKLLAGISIFALL